MAQIRLRAADMNIPCSLHYHPKHHGVIPLVWRYHHWLAARLQAALSLVRGSRNQLATALAEVSANTAIAEQQRQKQGLGRMADILLELQQVTQLHTELK